MTHSSRGAGRDGALSILRSLLVAAAALSHEGDTISSASLSRLLCCSQAEAGELLELLMGVGDTETAFYLPLAQNKAGLYLTHTPDYLARSLRLSHQETMALAAALSRVGITADNPLYLRVMSCYGCPDDDAVPTGATARPIHAVPTHSLMCCALAIASEKPLSFDYQGTKDETPRRRRVQPKELHQNGELWTLDALDLEACGERTFYLASMSTPQLDVRETPPDASVAGVNQTRRTVTLYFANRHLFDLLEWPDLEIVGEHNGVVEARIPFYGGPWLIRRIVAGGGSITTNDEALAAQVKAYAEELLNG